MKKMNLKWLICLVVLIGWFVPISANAQTISVRNGEYGQSITMFVGEEGTFTPEATEQTIVRWEYALDTYTYGETSCIALEQNGNYKALKTGTATVSVYGYDEYDYRIFNATCSVTVTYDMTNVVLDQTSIQTYIVDGYYSEAMVTINLTGQDFSADALVPTEDYDGEYLDCASSNKKMYVSGHRNGNVITLNTSNSGNTVVTFSVYDKVFTVQLFVSKITISNKSYILVKGKTKALQLNGISNDLIKWVSMNESIATISPTGVVKGKTYGNTVVYADISGQRIGCVVSVTKSTIKKAVEKAVWIGKHCKYSQAQRMSSKFYDCSSLTWKAYASAKFYIGSRGYAPVALDQARFCKNKKRMVKKGLTAKNIQTMKLNPGDLMFESTYPKKPYKDIYHVEMIAGYQCEGFSNDGTPIISLLWANRFPNYYWPQGQLVGRPVK